MKNNEFTDKEKLNRIREIVDKNLFSIFTAFTLDLEPDKYTENSLESYVELKELLNINEGISRKEALEFDKFKKQNKKEYKTIIKKLGEKIISQNQTGKNPFYTDGNVPSYMFMTAVYLTHIHRLSVHMSFEEYREALQAIDDYEFISG